MSLKSLGYLLSSTKKDKQTVASKLELLLDNPYSQVLARLNNKKDFDKKHILFKYDWYQSLGSEAFHKQEDLLNVGLVDISNKKSSKKKKNKSIETIPEDASSSLDVVKELITDQESPALVDKPVPIVPREKKIKKKKNKSIETIPEDPSSSLDEVKELITDQESPALAEKPVPIIPREKKIKKKKKLKREKDPEVEQEIILDSTLGEMDDFTKWINNISGIDSFEYAFEKKKKKKKKKKKDSLLSEIIESSNKVKNSIASEQLAELYTTQGHYDKAIQMYQKLSLKNPEKSSFFAPLIEELKNKQQ